MALIGLPLRAANETPKIYVNSNQVVTIRDLGQYSHIVTNVTDGGRAWQFSVNETAEEVIALINEGDKQGRG
jgi:hypothetical protein